MNKATGLALLAPFAPLFLVACAPEAARMPGLYAPSFQVSQETLADWVSVTDIRILIFPHLQALEPTGKDNRIDQAALVSSKSPCEVRRANAELDGPSGPVLESAKRVALRAAKLDRPLWITCAEPATLEREAGRRSFAYQGAFLVRRGEKVGAVHRLDVINVLPIEDYLRGVVPAEMEAFWPAEALRAQAVAARTYSVFHTSLVRAGIGQHRKLGSARDWDMDDTVQYQAYVGVAKEDARTDRAVADTAGVALTWQGKVIQAFFSADSGGFTEDSWEAWPGMYAPYCYARREVYADADLDMAKFGFWRAEGRLAALTAKLAAAGLVPEGRQVTGVSVAPGDRTRSGRARKVTLALDEGSQAADATAFRRALGLRSTLFKVENGGDGGAYALVGRGFGHGVGMSQVGAMTYAAKYAWDYRRILEFYYSGIQLCRDDGARCSPI